MLFLKNHKLNLDKLSLNICPWLAFNALSAFSGKEHNSRKGRIARDKHFITYFAFQVSYEGKSCIILAPECPG
jgi:hypothetical protein